MNVVIDMYKALITLQSKFWNVNSELLEQIPFQNLLLLSCGSSIALKDMYDQLVEWYTICSGQQKYGEKHIYKNHIFQLSAILTNYDEF